MLLFVVIFIHIFLVFFVYIFPYVYVYLFQGIREALLRSLLILFLSLDIRANFTEPKINLTATLTFYNNTLASVNHFKTESQTPVFCESPLKSRFLCSFTG